MNYTNSQKLYSIFVTGEDFSLWEFFVWRTWFGDFGFGRGDFLLGRLGFGWLCSVYGMMAGLLEGERACRHLIPVPASCRASAKSLLRRGATVLKIQVFLWVSTRRFVSLFILPLEKSKRACRFTNILKLIFNGTLSDFFCTRIGTSTSKLVGVPSFSFGDTLIGISQWLILAKN